MRFHKAKTKLSKRVGKNLFLKGARSFSAKDDFTKKPNKPGQHGNSRRPPRVSEYGKQLGEKQGIRFVYGLTEKQMRKVFSQSTRSKLSTGIAFLTILENRLDNVVYRGGLANSRSQARQLVNHSHFTVNGVKAAIPSMQVKAGDVIEVKPSKAKNAFWSNYKLEIPNEQVGWLDTNKMKIKVLSSPLEDDLPKDFNMPYIVEYYSRRVK